MDQIHIVASTINYIESHLDERLDLNRISKAMGYSKYHIHRLFVNSVGMTIRDYAHRRQLTEAAKLLVFSDMPIIQIALLCGYESQQAFSSVFKLMYKTSPAQFRCGRSFYPLQLRWTLHLDTAGKKLAEDAIRLAVRSDMDDWMRLAEMVVDGYPHMDEVQYRAAILRHIEASSALVLYDEAVLAGALAYSADTCSIDFLGVHPQYNRYGIHKMLLNVLIRNYLAGREISMTTFREGDKADTGYRELLKQLGFAERELLIEYGYPTQRFAICGCEMETDKL